MTDYKKYINALRKCAKEHENDITSTGYIVVTTLCKDTANLLESLEQEPKTGHWLMTGDYFTGAYEDIGYVECSCCHEDSLEEGDFCPNCGAKMD